MTAPRQVPMSMQQLQPRCKPVPVTVPMGELTPVRAGSHAATTFMRCPRGHVAPYMNSNLRSAAKRGKPTKCRVCREEARAAR